MNSFLNLYSEISPKYSLREKKEISRWTLMLPGAGCEYFKNTGGCTMCGFGNSTNKYTHGHLFCSGVFKLMYYLAEKEARLSKPKELFIYNGGSFWNDKEIPVKFQRYLYERVAKNPFVTRLFIENRCEYIKEAKIAEAVETIGHEKRLTIGIGLESYSDYVRNRIIKKGLSLKLFEEKVKIIRNFGAEVAVYIFLKPLGLSEQEALEEALSSINYVVSLGVNEVHLSCAFVQTNTKMATEFFAGNFKPPTLWSILEIIEQINKNNWPVLIGGFTDEPPPIAIPENCPKCSPAIYQAIEQYRQTRILGKIPECCCKTKPI
ncbi:MAG: hypothetical protein WCT50_02105 [Patescibacteria group bacterium]